MLYKDINNNPFLIKSDMGESGYIRYIPNRKEVAPSEYLVFDGGAVEAIIRYNNDDHVHIRFTQLGDTNRRADELLNIREEIDLILARVDSIDIAYKTIKEI